MTDEITDENYSVSLPLVKSNATPLDSIISTDLPTRVKLSPHYSKFLNDAFQGKCNENFYSGNLLKYTAVDGTVHDPVSVEVVHLPFDKQIVVDGYICPKQFVDKETGLCTYEKPMDVVGVDTIDVSSTLDDSSDIKSSAGQIDINDSAAPAVQKKCPICMYIENGPCKTAFNDWENCIASLETNATAVDGSSKASGDVSLCFDQTKEMMKCFMKYEYYDVMTAGMHDKMNVAFASTSTSTSETTPDVDSNTIGKNQNRLVNVDGISELLTTDMDSANNK